MDGPMAFPARRSLALLVCGLGVLHADGPASPGHYRRSPIRHPTIPKEPIVGERAEARAAAGKATSSAVMPAAR